MRGVCGPDGSRVYLEAAKCGSRWKTSEPALLRFLEAQAGGGRQQQQ